MKIRQGTTVLITGAASGIGRATAIAMAARGAGLFLTDINEQGLHETCGLIADKRGTVIHSKAFDITSLEDVQRFADEIHQKSGPVDIVINNAGIALFALIEDMSHDHWQRVINTNLWGPIHFIECFLPEMIREKKGHLVNVSSTAGLTGAPWHAAYSSAKWGLVGLSEVLRYDLLQHHIGVTVICPGAVDTPIKNSVEILCVDRENKAFRDIMRRFDKHSVTPEYVAKLIVRAVEKNKFMVITSIDIKALYFMKRYCFPIYHFVMKTVSKMMNSAKDASP